MKKQIFTIGYEIPGNSDYFLDFDDARSLMDADVLLISPESLRPYEGWVSFSSGGGGCYNVETSRRHQQKMSHLKKEIKDHLNAGKNVFILLAQECKDRLANSVSSPRKNENTYNTHEYSNYSFLPIDIGALTSASGKLVQFSGNPIFKDFYNKFKAYLSYELYIENSEGAQIVFTGKDKTKILGAIHKARSGHLVTLPMITFNEENFTEIKKDDGGHKKEFWNKAGLAFGNNLINCLLDINQKLTDNSEKTPIPKWAAKKEFLGKKENELCNLINKNNQKIEKIIQENEKLKIKLKEEMQLKDLLFEQGKPLENSIIKALKILGYQAENYDDGDLEMDQVITSPEKNRYIGESEGKDSKDINITKFRQLTDALNADFAREEVEEKAFGILFGNAERLKAPEERKLDFTTKCKSGALREKIALVKTVDLFEVAKFLNENNDEKFKKSCRDAIHKGLGKLVKFPSTPKE